jgi:hypothetical protein
MANSGPNMAILALGLLLLAAHAHAEFEALRLWTDPGGEALLSDQFAAWARQHGRVYGGAEERQRRFHVWKENLDYIQRHRESPSSYQLGLTRFADLTNEEFRRQFTGTRIDRSRRTSRRTPFRYADAEAPDSVDWRTKGAVTKVKDQGSCGKQTNPLQFQSHARFSQLGSSIRSVHLVGSNSPI